MLNDVNSVCSQVNPKDDLARGIFDLNIPKICSRATTAETETEPLYADDDWM